MKEDTVNNILAVGTDLILKKGYHNVGLKEILDAARIPKGSFYYYFRNKEDFGNKVIQYYSNHSLSILNRYLKDEDQPPRERLLSFFTDMKAVYEEKQFREGCLLGNCSLELSDVSESFGQSVAQELGRWQKSIEDCIREGQEQGTIANAEPAETLADFILTTWEGSLLRMKSSKSTASIEVFIHFLQSYLL